MKIIYPYNETLPLKRAHDAYIVRNCHALASSGVEVTLVCGKGSLSYIELLKFYNLEPIKNFKIVQLPILRKKSRLGLQWNSYFFYFCQKYIKRMSPDVVICSVIKQANYHFKRKLAGIKYIYEVHQVQKYPTTKNVNQKKFNLEKSVFERADLITVTTNALKEILIQEPYKTKAPVEKVSLACNFLPLQHSKTKEVLKLYYVGQLYASQGLDRLLDAMQDVERVSLVVVGGKDSEIEHYKLKCKKLKIESKVEFIGFVKPDQLSIVLKDADVFVTSFDNSERMPYVAHTKLYEYLAWQRPIIAPNLKVVLELKSKSILGYRVDDENSLAGSIKKLTNSSEYEKLLEEAKKYKTYSWDQRSQELIKSLTKIST